MISRDLEWIDGQPRTPPEERERTTKFDTTVARTVKDLRRELKRLGVDDYNAHIGNNHTKSDGMPLHDANPDDPGFSLFWSRDGRSRGVACDRYTSLAANMRTVYKWFNETRLSGDRPVTTARDQFAAAALPGETEDPVQTAMTEEEARAVLNVTAQTPVPAVKAAAQELTKQAHPDNGGSRQRLSEVREAKSVLLD